MNSVTVYTATGEAVTLYREPPTTPAITTQTNAMPAVSDIIAMAQPGERVTVSVTVERTSTTQTQHSNVIGADEFGQNVYAVDNSKTLFMAVIGMVGVVLFIKVVEVIAEHPTEFAVGIGAIACLLAAFALMKGGKRQ
ncbi:MAG: hypothetical protein BWK73_26800 [Thiothrix lacustris]|uniref:Uncharacterized protein n=1 Tax=Thiothrix lacustris TaxID=525917 RepID=A0A1Y1QKI9_9GAMM|nr:MAG: hypothetical protein BWK73_26800 [Thiothrix lacustris]